MANSNIRGPSSAHRFEDDCRRGFSSTHIKMTPPSYARTVSPAAGEGGTTEAQSAQVYRLVAIFNGSCRGRNRSQGRANTDTAHSAECGESSDTTPGQFDAVANTGVSRICQQRGYSVGGHKSALHKRTRLTPTTFRLSPCRIHRIHHVPLDLLLDTPNVIPYGIANIYTAHSKAKHPIKKVEQGIARLCASGDRSLSSVAFIDKTQHIGGV